MMCVEPQTISGPHFAHSMCIVAKSHQCHRDVTEFYEIYLKNTMASLIKSFCTPTYLITFEVNVACRT